MAEMNQQLWRRDRNVKDEFGRLWLVSFETTPTGGGSNMPTGQITPAGWADPLGMPQEYLAIPKGEFGEWDRNRITVIPGMVRWLEQQRAAELVWRQELRKEGVKRYKEAFDPVKANEDEVLLDVVGPRPWPLATVIAAALKGDKGYLGIEPLSREQRNVLGKETLEDLGFAPQPTVIEQTPVPTTRTVGKLMPYLSFVAEMRKANVTDPKEIKAHWEVYKSEVRSEAEAS